ncbi:MAG: hypothetical protein GTO30_01210 [Acidobacteria bacterium]|nr:hypothetical protein [Acidobacteriota bacterium]NIM60301.1 hypothetical protein [Acidobacteriota bacterium]NIQ85577.1 hypothetical protein [Acidobacteriota bacterium]NIT11290.1 hypothetical protein [Acidobacteriota bacterium]
MRPRTAIAIALAVGALLALPASAQEDADPIRARTFRVEFKPLSEAAELIEPMLTDDGGVMMRPRQKSLIVEDRSSVLERIGQVLESFDLPPRSVKVTFVLFLGRDIREKPSRPASSASVFSEDVNAVIEALADVTKWTSYEPLGSRSVRGQEGGGTVADLSSDYRISFEIDTVTRRGGEEIVKFDRIVLQRVGRDDEGKETLERLYATAGTLKTGMLNVLGAASAPGADRALFLTMQVEAE